MDKEDHSLKVPSDAVEYEAQSIASLVFGSHVLKAGFCFHVSKGMLHCSSHAGPLFVAFLLSGRQLVTAIRFFQHAAVPAIMAGRNRVK